MKLNDFIEQLRLEAEKNLSEELHKHARVIQNKINEIPVDEVSFSMVLSTILEGLDELEDLSQEDKNAIKKVIKPLEKYEKDPQASNAAVSFANIIVKCLSVHFTAPEKHNFTKSDIAYKAGCFGGTMERLESFVANAATVSAKEVDELLNKGACFFSENAGWVNQEMKSNIAQGNEIHGKSFLQIVLGLVREKECKDPYWNTAKMVPIATVFQARKKLLESLKNERRERIKAQFAFNDVTGEASSPVETDEKAVTPEKKYWQMYVGPSELTKLLTSLSPSATPPTDKEVTESIENFYVTINFVPKFMINKNAEIRWNSDYTKKLKAINSENNDWNLTKEELDALREELKKDPIDVIVSYVEPISFQPSYNYAELQKMKRENKLDSLADVEIVHALRILVEMDVGHVGANLPLQQALYTIYTKRKLGTMPLKLSALDNVSGEEHTNISNAKECEENIEHFRNFFLSKNQIDLNKIGVDWLVNMDYSRLGTELAVLPDTDKKFSQIFDLIGLTYNEDAQPYLNQFADCYFSHRLRNTFGNDAKINKELTYIKTIIEKFPQGQHASFYQNILLDLTYLHQIKKFKEFFNNLPPEVKVLMNDSALLEVAVNEDNVDLVDFLVKKGADPHKRNNNGDTLFSYAVRTGVVGLAEALNIKI